MPYPDAYLKHMAKDGPGEVCCIQTDTPLPSYSGLCLAEINGAFAVMYTEPGVEHRVWDLVHWGSQLSSVEISKYMERKDA